MVETDGVVCREGMPAHSTTEGGSQSTRSEYGAICIRDKRTRQQPWSTSLTTQGQARSTTNTTNHQHGWRIGRGAMGEGHMARRPEHAARKPPERGLGQQTVRTREAEQQRPASMAGKGNSELETRADGEDE